MMTERRCLREPIAEIEVAARRLDEAVSAHLRGQRAQADELLRLADDPIVRDWLESVWGKVTVYNRPRRIVSHPPSMAKELRPKPRDATPATKRLIHARDGYYCRFCKMPVIRGEVRQAIRLTYPDAVSWGDSNRSQHAGFQCLWAQYDHIVPNARGGHSTLENMYLTCAACNYGRGSSLLEEFDLVHPDQHAVRVGAWDGLERFSALATLDTNPVRRHEAAA